MTTASTTADTAGQLDPQPGWASAHGFLALQRPDRDTTAARAADKALVAETMHRFAFAYDEQNGDILTDCFTADAVLSATTAGTHSFGTYEGRPLVIKWLSGYWGKTTDQRRHIITNVVVDDLTDTTATASTMLLVTAAENGAFRPVTAGLYRAQLRKEGDGAWRIATFDLGFDASF